MGIVNLKIKLLLLLLLLPTVAYWCHMVSYIFVNIGWGNGLMPNRQQAYTWFNDDHLSTGPSGTNFSEIWIKIHWFSLNKMHFKMFSAKCRPFCSGFIVLTHWGRDKMDTISQTTISNTFSWMKMLEFGLKFHWSLLPRVQSTIF